MHHDILGNFKNLKRKTSQVKEDHGSALAY